MILTGIATAFVILFRVLGIWWKKSIPIDVVEIEKHLGDKVEVELVLGEIPKHTLIPGTRMYIGDHHLETEGVQYTYLTNHPDVYVVSDYPLQTGHQLINGIVEKRDSTHYITVM